MKLIRKLRSDCDAHAVCHDLEKIIKIRYPESSLLCVEHKTVGHTCAFRGTIGIGYEFYPVAFHALCPRTLEISIAGEPSIGNLILDNIIDEFSKKRDAGGFTHNLTVDVSL